MSAERVKLSAGAARLLERLGRDEVACSPARSTALELRRADYADWNDRAGPRSWWLRITEAGRAALTGSSS